jgi:hypothetical protein
MKNQYFGDINDYMKYGILRILTDYGNISCSICWMLTDNDGRTDGKFTSYLKNAGELKKYDPELFDWLNNHFANDLSRNVSFIQESELLKKCSFYSSVLTDTAKERQEYLKEFTSLSSDFDLVFFDPDNGFEVASTPYGKKDSSKYLYWEELIPIYKRGHSILVYQHFPRISRAKFIQDAMLKIKDKLSADSVIALSTNNVVYFLILQPNHEQIKRQVGIIKERWKGQIIITSNL